jgi:outer membrane receptor protein involved in Fe transport
LSTTTPLVGGRPPTVTTFDDVSLTSFDPRLAVSVRATDALELTASGYRAFRSPTLNELYRSFRVGDTVTLANPDLRTEGMWGGEVGARARVGVVALTSTAFWNETKEPVANVTLTQTPALITRQRQNLGRTRAAGFEVAAEARPFAGFLVAAGYAFTDGVVAGFPPSPELVGNLLPQLARHQGSLRASHEAGRLRLAASARLMSDQYEDDRNSLVLPGFATLDAQAAVRVTASTEAFVAVENATGERYLVGLTPLPTLGPPRLFRAGLRARWGRDPRP